MNAMRGTRDQALNRTTSLSRRTELISWILKTAESVNPEARMANAFTTKIPDRHLGSPVVKASNLDLSSNDPIFVHQTFIARNPSMASANQQKSTFLPLSPTRSAPSASPPTSPTVAKIQSPGANDDVSTSEIIVPFGRDRSDSNASAESANSYLWLSTAKKD